MKIWHLLILLAAGLTSNDGSAQAGETPPLDGQSWLVKIESKILGPLETVLHFEANDDELLVHNTGATRTQLLQLVSDNESPANVNQYSFAFSLKEQDGGYSAQMLAPWPDSKITFIANENGFFGAIKSGPLKGKFSSIKQYNSNEPLRDYRNIHRSMEQTLKANIYDKKALMHPAYLKYSAQMNEIAALAKDDLDYMLGHQFAWTGEAFSHFEYRRSAISAADLKLSFTDFRLGAKAAHVRFDENNIATLTITWMLGKDVYKQVENAFEEIAQRNPPALIIDLRNNPGGAFVIDALIKHIIDEPLTSGYFITRHWTDNFERLPTLAELAKVEPWTALTLPAFWHDVERKPIIKIVFQPSRKFNYDGPVIVVAGKNSKSATEFAVDALKSSGLVTVVGEQTAGDMLSQNFYDVGLDQFLIAAPVSEYISIANGHIEGTGVSADVLASDEESLDIARKIALKKL